jgi:hypothetical protein
VNVFGTATRKTKRLRRGRKRVGCPASGAGVFAQRYSSGGAKIGSEFQVNSQGF